MIAISGEKSWNPELDKRSDFFNYKLSISKNYISILACVAALLNVLLLFPDYEHITGASEKTVITVLRVSYSVMLIAMGFGIRKITTFKTWAIALSLCEILAILIFLYVFSQYSKPNFLIQAMGIMTLVIITFLIPNRWRYMLFIAFAGAIGYFISALVHIKTIAVPELVAAVSYVAITILLCAISARNAERHQFREFVAKTELERLSTTDFLTHAANRYKLEEAAERWMSFCRRQAMPLALVFIDVDNLKIVNDRFGHSAGDSVLSGLAMLIQSHLRSSDILARWGGDEFVILLPNISLENAEDLIKKIENSIDEQIFIDGFRVTCSFGAVEMKKGSDFETLICQADKLMYDNKPHGKDKTQYEMQLP